MKQKEFEHIAIGLRKKAIAVASTYKLTVDEQEDIAQDTMLKLWNMHVEIRSDNSAFNLSGIIAKHCCIDFLRTQHRTEDIEDELLLYDNDSPQRNIEYEELSIWIDNQINHLPSTSGIILRMRQLEHRETEEIARVLGITVQSVNTLLSRARRQLYEELKKRDR